MDISAVPASTAAPPTNCNGLSPSPNTNAPSTTAKNASSVITTEVRLGPKRNSPAYINENAALVANA
jgi:hypothetical protein